MEFSLERILKRDQPEGQIDSFRQGPGAWPPDRLVPKNRWIPAMGGSQSIFKKMNCMECIEFHKPYTFCAHFWSLMLLLIPPQLIMRTIQNAYHCPLTILLHEPDIRSR